MLIEFPYINGIGYPKIHLSVLIFMFIMFWLSVDFLKKALCI